MKQVLQQYAAYNLWANKILADRISILDEGKLSEALPGSFKSIFATILHLWNTESVWWQRLRLEEQVMGPAETFSGNLSELLALWHKQSTIWKDWVHNAPEIALNHVFAYRDSKKLEYKQPVYEALIHLFNHQSYHRGQLITQLHQIGEEKLPATDFILFTRKPGR